MATIAAFIGVDRHSAPDIRDLSGAKRDAIALWSLFTDTIPELNATVLCDERATVANAQQALTQTLQSAGPEDTVIFTFSGHGTPDHRLVMHDTQRGSLHDTTISMTEVANAFRGSAAGVIICVIDCCFSGGAPARVLDDAPLPRDPGDDAYSGVIGTGRVLLAASHTNEVAYEHPRARHGLLTKAMIEVLTGLKDPIGIGQILDLVLDRVRADASTIGVTQTPYLVNRVEGGLKLPPLSKGKEYSRNFPEFGQIQVGGSFEDLSSFGIPADILTRWKERYPGGLNELQQDALNRGRILAGGSLLVVAPTSSGKTFVGELATTRAVAEGRRAVFLFPYKALVNEKYDQFRTLYGEHLDYRVIRCTGDYGDDINTFSRGKYEIAILTYEMFLALALNSATALNSVGLIVVDEVHFIADPNRGMTVELLLTYLITTRERGIAPQLIALSAVIGGVNDFDAWLNCDLLMSDRRPVPLVEGVIDRTGCYQFLDLDGQVKTEQLLPQRSIIQRKDKPGAQDVIVPLVQKLVAAGEKVIVFRNQRGKAEGCASYLADSLGSPGDASMVGLLPAGDISTSSRKLRHCLSSGTAFHTSNLSREEREMVERAFRSPIGSIKALAATTTVAAGINTPADTVIIAEQEFRGEDGRPFTVAEYKNMAGRAGRLGITDRGRSIIYAENPLQRMQLFDRYVAGTPDDLRSSFREDDVETWLIRLLAQVPALPRQEVAGLLYRSFGGFLRSRDNPKWQVDVAAHISQLVDQMLALGLVEEELGKIRLTLLGRACGSSTLSFVSALRLVELTKRFAGRHITPMTLACLIQALPELDRTYTPLYTRNPGKEAGWRDQVARALGADLAYALQAHAADNNAYLARCKRSSMLQSWIEGTPTEEIERLFTTNPFYPFAYGDVRSIADATRFHLRSARQIVSLLLIAEQSFEEGMDMLLQQLEIGVPADTLELLALPVRLERGDYLRLRAAGLTSPALVTQATREQIEQAAGAVVAARLRPTTTEAQ